MKKTLIFAAAAMLVLPASAQTEKLRDTVNINFGWLFGRDKGNISEAVDLPHDFQISQPWMPPSADEKADNNDPAANIRSRLSSRAFKEMGQGWYKYQLNAPQEWKGKRVLLDIQGLMYVGNVYLNGKEIGKTDYGYVGFDIDISKDLKWGQNNEIMVFADTREPLNSRWYTGAGLIRDVNVVVTNPNLYFARHPLYITTKDNKEVNIKAEIVYKGKAKGFDAEVRILDMQGKEVAKERTNLKFHRLWRDREYQLNSINLGSPRLWSPEDPYLYTAEVTLYDEQGKAVDKISEQFGVRTLEFSPKFGMKLNGKKVLLKGFANHHTLGALGAAAYPRAIEKRLQMMKEFGYNHVRTSHNPYSEDFLKLCDKYGFLVVDELYDKWNDKNTGGRAEWSSLWQKDIPEFITRDRNHPTVVLWSLGNELQQNADMSFNDWGVTVYKMMRMLVSRYDSTRLVTVAMHPRYRSLETDSIPAPLALATDVASYNYRYMYFPGDSKRFPNMMFYQSEANTSNMGPNFFEMDLDKVIGLAYWGAIDYLGESGGWPAKGWAQGSFDISLQPKPIAYLVRSMFKDEPTVHIGVVEKASEGSMWNHVNVGTDLMSESWNRTPGSKVNLYTYTNADEVELFVNGKSQGVKKNTKDPKGRNKLKWNDIPYEEGYVEAVARTNGKEVARHRLETTGEAVKLQLIPDNNAWKADGMDLQHVRVLAVDKKGRRVWGCNKPLTFTVEGDAKIIGTDNGDITSDELQTSNKRSLFQGSALVILRSGKKGGKVTLKASGDGFNASVKLR